MISALLFDVDGVLVDSEDISIEIGIEFFRTLGYSLEKKDFFPHLGIGEATFFSGPARDNGISFSLADASAFFKERYPQIIEKKDIALPGARDLLEKAKKAGFKIAVASSAPRWKVIANVNAIGFPVSFFDAFISGEDILRNKPFPDIYALSMIRLGVGGEDAVVFEDSRGGIRAGKSADIFTVGLKTTISEEDAYSSGADVVIDDLSAIPSFSSREELSAFFTSADKEKALLFRAKSAIGNAYCEYSSFPVAAAVLSESGKIYAGVNVENSSYGATICAERSATLSMIAREGKKKIEKVLVYTKDKRPTPPCGMCLQFLSEFSSEGTEFILCTESGLSERHKFSELYPNAFRLEK